MEPYVQAETVAEFFDCCTETINRHRRAGMPCLPFGLHYRYRLSECEAWLRGRAEIRQGEVVQLRERGAA